MSYNSSYELPVRSPVVRSAPALAGDDRLGGELTCSRGTWDDRGLPAPYAVAYAWQRDGEPIEGADSARHTVVRDDVGHALACVVTAEGATEAVTGAAHPAGPRNGTPPQIGGDLRVGGIADVLARDVGRRLRSSRSSGCATAHPVATGATYRVDMLDVGSELRCRVTAEELTTVDEPAGVPGRAPQPHRAAHLRRPAGRRDADVRHRHLGRRLSAGDPVAARRRARPRPPRSASTPAPTSASRSPAPSPLTASPRRSQTVVPTAPAVRTGPAIDGDARLGRTVTCDTGTWDGTYALTSRVAARRRARRHRRAADASAPPTSATTCAAASPPPGSPRSSRAPRSSPRRARWSRPRCPATRSPGGTLTCGAGAWDGDYALTYRWLRDGADRRHRPDAHDRLRPRARPSAASSPPPG